MVTLLSEYIGEKEAALYVEDMCLADYLSGQSPTDITKILASSFAEMKKKQGGWLSPVPLYDFGLGMFQCQPEGKGNDLEQAIRGYAHFSVCH